MSTSSVRPLEPPGRRSSGLGPPGAPRAGSPRGPSPERRLRVRPGLGALLGSLLAAGCVTETVRPQRGFPDTVAAGAVHGVSLYFEVRPGDVPDPEARRQLEEAQRTLVLPVLDPATGAEVYRLLDLHEVRYLNNLWEVGGFRYPGRARAQLYVFKPVHGNFEFWLHGQRVLIIGDGVWTPSVYRYEEELPGSEGVIYTSEHLQIGLASIVTDPVTGTWLVNGKRYYPSADKGKALELRGALHAGPR